MNYDLKVCMINNSYTHMPLKSSIIDGRRLWVHEFLNSGVVYRYGSQIVIKYAYYK